MTTDEVARTHGKGKVIEGQVADVTLPAPIVPTVNLR